MNKTLTILIIDDCLDDREYYSRLFKKMGGEHFVCIEASNGHAGIEAIKNNPVDCVLLDYNLPDIDGLNVLQKIIEANHYIPVIMMTGEGNELIAVSAMKLGSQDYLSKKVLTSTALVRAVERAVERADMMHCMERYKTQLERSNEDLEQFAHIVAHDLKAPLRAITQHLNIIESKVTGLLDEKSRRSLDFAVEGATRMRLLIEALFEYARIGFSEPELEILNLESLLEQTKSDLSAVIEERDAIIQHEPLPNVKGDSILLAQLLQNLIANAIKYCEQQPRIHISATIKDGQWYIHVQDNGIGIPTSQQKQIFTIFRRLHVQSEYPGIGLGLAICDRIVKQHNGTITVESTPGNGSCFIFTLPKLQEPTQHENMRAYG